MSEPRAYYNEIDPKAAAWLRELIARNLIAPGDVDERSIEVVAADDLKPYTQCHFFAGIGVWSYALRRAGWDDARPVWTGSCPCQPFSGSGKQSGFADERHLWPHFYRLIAERRPPTVFGEQVASPLGLVWLDALYADLEASSYAVGSADLGAAGVGAPHIRQRLYWVADAAHERHERPGRAWDGWPRFADHRAVGRVAHDNQDGCERIGAPRLHDHRQSGNDAPRCCADGGLANAPRVGREEERPHVGRSGARDRPEGIGPGSRASGDDLRAGPTNGFWGAADWLLCTDGKWRPVEPESFPLAHGAPERVGRLRGYGNAIVAQVATAFIEAYTEARGGLTNA